MHHTHSGRPARTRQAVAVALVLTAALAAALALTGARAASAAAPITVRIEGTTSTLLPTTVVRLGSAKVVKNGVAADSCSGASAAGALEVATHGNWKGTWSASYKSYFLSSIDGLGFPSTGAKFWAFWVNDAPATLGICGYDPKPGDSILFFPDCYGKTCPKNNGVLGVRAAAVATVGKPLTVTVTAYSDAKGTPSAAAGATVSGGGVTATTAAGGTATLSFAHAGRVTLKVSAPHALRTEAAVCVQSAGAHTCG